MLLKVIPALSIALIFLNGCSNRDVRTIVCFGDSLTAGPHLLPEETYPARLRKILRDKGYQYEVINSGLSGETTGEGLLRIDSALRIPADLLILELGTNDVLRGKPPEEIKRNLAEIIRKVQAKKLTIVLAGTEAPQDASPEYRSKVISLYRELSVQFKIPLMPNFMKDVLASQDTLHSDGIHYNAKGARILADSVYHNIRPLLH